MGVMFVIILFAVLCTIGSIMEYKNIWSNLPKETKRYRFYKKFICCWGSCYGLFAVIFGGLLIGFGIAIININSPTTQNALNSELAIKREYIVSQLESGVYRTIDDENIGLSFGRDSSYGMKETMKEAMEFDSEIEAQRIKRNSFWIGIFNTPIDDSIQPINAMQYVEGSIEKNDWFNEPDVKPDVKDSWVFKML